MDEAILDHNSLDFIETYLVAPERIQTLGLEANRRGVADHSRVVVAEAAQVPVDGGCRQLARCELLEAVGRIDAVLHEQLQDAHRREMVTLRLRDRGRR